MSIGEDGPSQMALEDLAMFRSIPTATVFYPSDAVSTERACELAANTPGICFIRTSRPGTAVVYDNDHKFEVCKGLQGEAGLHEQWSSCKPYVYLFFKKSNLMGESANLLNFPLSSDWESQCAAFIRG